MNDTSLRLLRHRRSPVTVALALLGALVAVAAAGAATGLLPVGTAIPGEQGGFRHNGAPPDQTVVANGATAVAGPWRLTSFRSEGIVEDGAMVEPAGMPCVLLMLTDPPPKTPFRAGTICRAPGKSDFNVTSVPVWNAGSGDAELVLLGFAPAGAATVELRSEVGNTIRSEVYEGAGLPGPVWVMAVPRGPKTGRLDWINNAGKPAGEPLDASDQFNRMAP